MRYFRKTPINGSPFEDFFVVLGKIDLSSPPIGGFVGLTYESPTPPASNIGVLTYSDSHYTGKVGSSGLKAHVLSAAALPLLKNGNGDLRYCIAERSIYAWDSTTRTWNDTISTEASDVSYDGGPAWRDGTTNPAITKANGGLQTQVDKVITDLGSGAGTTKISVPAISGTPVFIPAGTLTAALSNLLSAVNNRGIISDTNSWEAANQFESSVEIDGLTTMNAKLTITAGGIQVTGLAAFDTSVAITGTVSTTGAGTIGGTLGVTGATTLASTLAVTGPTTLNNTLNVSGLSTLGALAATTATLGTLAAGNTAVTGTVSVSGTTTAANINCSDITAADVGCSSLTVSGTSFMVDDVTISAGNLAVTTGDVTVNTGDLDVTSGNITVPAGSVSCVDLSSSGDLSVTGTTTLNDDVNITGTSNLVFGTGKISTGGLTPSAAAGSIICSTLEAFIVKASFSGGFQTTATTIFRDITLTGQPMIQNDGTVKWSNQNFDDNGSRPWVALASNQPIFFPLRGIIPPNGIWPTNALTVTGGANSNISPLTCSLCYRDPISGAFGVLGSASSNFSSGLDEDLNVTITAGNMNSLLEYFVRVTSGSVNDAIRKVRIRFSYDYISTH